MAASRPGISQKQFAHPVPLHTGGRGSRTEKISGSNNQVLQKETGYKTFCQKRGKCVSQGDLHPPARTAEPASGAGLDLSIPHQNTKCKSFLTFGRQKIGQAFAAGAFAAGAFAAGAALSFQMDAAQIRFPLPSVADDKMRVLTPCGFPGLKKTAASDIIEKYFLTGPDAARARAPYGGAFPAHPHERRLYECLTKLTGTCAGCSGTRT